MEISLKLITVDSALQPRIEGLNDDHVRALEAVVENWLPLALVKRDEGYVLVDGFHRFAAAQNLGLEAVPVTVLDMPADGDLHALAFALNACHGRPLTLSDRRTFACRSLTLHPNLSDREIGRRAGLAQPTIAKLRAELEAQHEIEPTDSRIGGDGKTYAVEPRAPTREMGAMPDAPLEPLFQRLFESKDRRAQRKLVSYFQRLALALGDGFEFENWATADEAADACRAVLSAEQSERLAKELGAAASNVLDVAFALGYSDEPSDE